MRVENAVLKMLRDIPGYSLQLIQLESLGLVKCVHERLRTYGVNWMCATFWDGAFLPGCLYSDRLAMHLARGTDIAKTLVFPCHVTHVVLADPLPQYLAPSQRSGLLAKLKEGIAGCSRLMVSRHDAIHFTTIDMLRTEIGNCREICASLADSGSAPRTLEQRVLYALTFLFEDTAAKAGMGIDVLCKTI
jgi:hypothetical protein